MPKELPPHIKINEKTNKNLQLSRYVGAATAAANGVASGQKEPITMPIFHRLGCGPDEAEAIITTWTSHFEQVGLNFSTASIVHKDTASIVRVVDRSGFTLWFKIDCNRPLGRLMRSYAQLRVREGEWWEGLL